MPAATLEKDGIDGDALHWEKNRPDAPPVKFPVYRFQPFPTAVYRDWPSQALKEAEIRRAAAKCSLDLSNPSQAAVAASMVSDYETKTIGVSDMTFANDKDRDGAVQSELRERNERMLADHLANGWALSPEGVKAATAKMNFGTALAAGERAHDDRRLGEKARAEIDAIEAVADGHVVDVAESRRAATESGALKKDKR